MSLFISSLNSGSNGNCYYVGNGSEAVLIDAGISCRETERRMQRLNLPMSSVRAIFVSHEHSDHITGIRVLSKKYQLPVYITASTLRSAGKLTEKHLIYSFSANTPVTIGGLSVTAFTKSHDASDPHSFVVSGNRINIGVFTDIGNCCKEVIRYFKKCHAVFLESNYCEDMLMNGDYPYYLKKRISADNGHLSNKQALELFIQNRSPKLSHLILSHLSKNNNRPELVDRLFKEQAGDTRIVVASRYEETPVYHITSDIFDAEVVVKKYPAPQQVQLSLF
jgi:phosphoribosyl 1,2-cyclic phosphodiesterase